MIGKYKPRSGGPSSQACQFALKIFVFAVVAMVLIHIYLKSSAMALKAIHGPSTTEQISESFSNALSRKYDCLILGNSRIYRGVNPDVLWCSAYNFSHDNDSFNQDYFKLIYLEQHGVTYKYLVLGVDYFEFSFLASSRNNIYGRYFGKDYLKDFHDSLNDRFNTFMALKFTQPFPETANYWYHRALGESLTNGSYLKPNGQFIAAYRKSKEWWRDVAKRDGGRLPIEEAYFENVLIFARQHNTPLVLVMPPTRADELKSYDAKTIAEFDNIFSTMARQYGGEYLNYSHSLEFVLNDYMDATHLDPQAADRFSVMLSKDASATIANANSRGGEGWKKMSMTVGAGSVR